MNKNLMENAEKLSFFLSQTSYQMDKNLQMYIFMREPLFQNIDVSVNKDMHKIIAVFIYLFIFFNVFVIMQMLFIYLDIYGR